MSRIAKFFLLSALLLCSLFSYKLFEIQASPILSAEGAPNAFSPLAEKRTLGIEWGETFFFYDGEEHIPSATATNVAEGDKVIFQVEGAQVDEGTYWATVTGFSVTPKSHENQYRLPEKTSIEFTIGTSCPLTLDWGELTFSYNGKPQAPSPKILSGLRENDEVFVRIPDSEKKVLAGSYLACAIPEGRDAEKYTISNPTATFEILGIDLEIVWESTEFLYDGNPHCPEPKALNLAEGDRITFQVESAQTEAGEYWANIKDFSVSPSDRKKSYSLPEKTSVAFTIQKAQSVIDTSHVQTEYTYNGNLQTVDLSSVTYLGDGELSYTNNTFTTVPEGNGLVIGLNLTEGKNFLEASAEIRITVHKATLDKNTIFWDYESPFTYDGEEKVVALSGLPKEVSAQYENNAKLHAGRYFATAKLLYDEENYTAPEEIKPLEWEIQKAQNILDTSKVQTEYTYNGNLQIVDLSSVTFLGDGELTYTKNTFTTVSEGNGLTITIILSEGKDYLGATAQIQIVVHKAALDLREVQWNYESPFTYDGDQKVVELENLPKEVSARYENNVKFHAGRYFASAKLIYDEENYTAPEEILPLEWEIQKAQNVLDTSHVQTEYIYNGNLQTVDLSSVTYLGDGELSYTKNIFTTVSEGNGLIITLTLSEGTDYLGATAQIQIVVHKATLDISAVYWNYEFPFTYDGEEKVVALENLPIEVSASYENNAKLHAGHYLATASLIYDEENYTALEEITPLEWEIQKAQNTLDTSKVQTEYTYNGNLQTVDLSSVTYLGDGELSYTKNIFTTVSEGNGLIIELTLSEGKDYLGATAQIQITVHKATLDISAVCWDYEFPFTYDGEQKVVSLSGLPKEVSAQYENNVKLHAGRYFASAKLIYDEENYTAPEEILLLEWEIQKAQNTLDTSKVQTEYTYNGNLQTVDLSSVTFFGDGKLSYTNNTFTTVPEGDGLIIELTLSEGTDYLGATAQIQIIVHKADLDLREVQWNYESPFTYDGEEKVVALENLPKEVSASYENNKKLHAGRYFATAKLLYDEGNYNALEEITPLEWEIQKAQNVLDTTYVQTEYTYNGNLQVVDLSCVTYLGDGELSYTNNTFTTVSEGDGLTITITLSEGTDYLGVTAQIQIFVHKATLDISGVYWNYESSFTYDGEEKVVALENLPKGVSASYENNAKLHAGRYFATASLIYDEENYTAPEEILPLEWEIQKAQNVLDTSKVQTEYTYNGNLQIVDLSTVTFLGDGELSYTNNTFATVPEGDGLIIELTLSEGTDYLGATAQIQIVVHKATLDISAVYWNYKSPFTYDGEEKVVALENLPKEVSASYENNAKLHAGRYLATASLIYDEENYTAPEGIPSLEWEIQKAQNTLDTSKVQTEYTYNGNLQTVDLSSVTFLGDGELTYTKNTFTTVSEGNGLTITIILSEGTDYLGATAQIQIMVRRAKNQWTQFRVEGDQYAVILPEAKFGKTQVKFYSDRSCTQEAQKFRRGEQYYIRYWVEGTENYEGIEERATIFLAKPNVPVWLIALPIVGGISILVVVLGILFRKKKGRS